MYHTPLAAALEALGSSVCLPAPAGLLYSRPQAGGGGGGGAVYAHSVFCEQPVAGGSQWASWGAGGAVGWARDGRIGQGDEIRLGGVWALCWHWVRAARRGGGPASPAVKVPQIQTNLWYPITEIRVAHLNTRHIASMPSPSLPQHTALHLITHHTVARTISPSPQHSAHRPHTAPQTQVWQDSPAAPPSHLGTTLSTRLLEDYVEDGRDDCFCFRLLKRHCSSGQPPPEALCLRLSPHRQPPPSSQHQSHQPRGLQPPPASVPSPAHHILSLFESPRHPLHEAVPLAEQNPWGRCCTRGQPDALSLHPLPSPAAAVPHAACSCWACSSPSHVAAAPSGSGRQCCNRRRPLERPVRGPGGRGLRETDRT